MNTLDKTVAPWLEKEIKTHVSKINALDMIFNAIQQATRNEQQAQERHQLRKFRSSSIDRARDQSNDFSR